LVVIALHPRATCVALALAFLASPQWLGAQQVDRAEAIRSLIAAERAFAKLAATDGIRDAFYANVADDGVIFRPRAIPGQKFLEGRPNVKGPAALLWDPRWVDVSASGDFGLSTGPSEFWPNGEADTVVSRGSFVTVWKRVGNGPWRFALDLGVSGPTKLDRGGEPRVASPAGTARAASSTADSSALFGLDARVGNDTVSATHKPRLIALLTDESRVYRLGQPIAIGANAAASLLLRNDGVVSSTRLGGDVARSGELAYTYGTYERIAHGDGSRRVVESGNYLRVWKRGADGRWKVALDLASPVN
jgi:ketosteroid isomerase-like protein